MIRRFLGIVIALAVVAVIVLAAMERRGGSAVEEIVDPADKPATVFAPVPTVAPQSQEEDVIINMMGVDTISVE